MPPLEGAADPVLHGRFLFYSRTQRAEESPRDFANTLMGLSKKCQFEADETFVNAIIRDRFIVGIRNKPVQDWILKSATAKHTLHETLELADKIPSDLITKRKPKKFLCIHCDSSFCQERNLLRHCKIIHKDLEIEGKENCDVCNEVFFSRKGLKRHCKMAHDLVIGEKKKTKTETVKPEPNLFRCDHCQSSFKYERNLTKHIKVVHSDVEIQGRRHCQVCQAVFFSELGLRQHHTKVHLDLGNVQDVLQQEKSFRKDVVVSKDLGKKLEDFNSIRAVECLNEEVIDVETTLDVTDGVEIAEKTLHLIQTSTGDEATITESIAIITDESEVQKRKEEEVAQTRTKGVSSSGRICEICGKLCVDLLMHFRNVHDSVRPFKCSMENCDFSHPLKGHLMQHIRQSHAPKSNFICDICGKRQKSAQAIREHIAMVHERSRPHKCPLCDKSFAKKQYIEEHVAVTHRGELPFGCKLCGEQFARRRNLMVHRRTVHENRWFDCNICEKRFKEKSAVKNHIKLVHENGFRYNCQECGAGFRSSKPYKEHLLLHDQK